VGLRGHRDRHSGIESRRFSLRVGAQLRSNYRYLLPDDEDTYVSCDSGIAPVALEATLAEPLVKCPDGSVNQPLLTAGDLTASTRMEMLYHPEHG